MSYEAWGEPDGRPYPTAAARRIRVRVEEGDFRGFNGRTPCAPDEPTRQCSICARHRPALARVVDRDTVLIDATTVTPPGLRCPMFARRDQ